MKAFNLIVILILVSLFFSCKEDKSSSTSLSPVEISQKIEKEASNREKVFNIEKENTETEETPKVEVKVEEVKPRISKEQKSPPKEKVKKGGAIINKKSSSNKIVVKSNPTPKVSKKKGKFKFNKDTYDFGFVDMGENVQYEFEFRNVGTKDINISSVDASCGCTTPTFPFLPIEPGKTGKIGVYFKSEGRLGGQKATVTIYSDAEESAKEIYLTGVVRAEMVKNEKDTIVLDSTSN